MGEAFDCALCEHKWLLGEAGTCDKINLTCVCPEGFSGVDDLFVSPTCHVNERAAFVIHMIAFAELSCTFAIVVPTLYLLIGRYRRTFTEQIGVQFGGSEKYIRAKKVQLDSTIGVGIITAANLSVLLYYGIFIAHGPDGKISFVSFRPLLEVLYCFATICFFVTISVFWGSLYYSISADSRFGEILGYEPFFIKYHSALKIINYSSMIILPLALMFVLLVLPEILEEEAFMKTPTIVYATMILVYLLGLFLGLDTVLRNIIKAFRVAAQSLTNKRNRSQHLTERPGEIERLKNKEKVLQVALDVAQGTLFLARFSLIGGILMYGLWVGSGGYYQYIFLNVGLSTGFLFIFFFPWQYKNTGGGMTPLFLEQHIRQFYPLKRGTTTDVSAEVSMDRIGNRENIA